MSATISRHGHTITFSTGRVAHAEYGIVGLGDDLVVTDGFDGDLSVTVEGERPDDDEEDALDPVERAELAELMIERWRRYGGV